MGAKKKNMFMVLFLLTIILIPDTHTSPWWKKGKKNVENEEISDDTQVAQVETKPPSKFMNGFKKLTNVMKSVKKIGSYANTAMWGLKKIKQFTDLRKKSEEFEKDLECGCYDEDKEEQNETKEVKTNSGNTTLEKTIKVVNVILDILLMILRPILGGPGVALTDFLRPLVLNMSKMVLSGRGNAQTLFSNQSPEILPDQMYAAYPVYIPGHGSFILISDTGSSELVNISSIVKRSEDLANSERRGEVTASPITDINLNKTEYIIDQNKITVQNPHTKLHENNTTQIHKNNSHQNLENSPNKVHKNGPNTVHENIPNNDPQKIHENSLNTRTVHENSPNTDHENVPTKVHKNHNIITKTHKSGPVEVHEQDPRNEETLQEESVPKHRSKRSNNNNNVLHEKIKSNPTSQRNGTLNENTNSNSAANQRNETAEVIDRELRVAPIFLGQTHLIPLEQYPSIFRGSQEIEDVNWSPETDSMIRESIRLILGNETRTRSLTKRILIGVLDKLKNAVNLF